MSVEKLQPMIINTYLEAASNLTHLALRYAIPVPLTARDHFSLGIPISDALYSISSISDWRNIKPLTYQYIPYISF